MHINSISSVSYKGLNDNSDKKHFTDNFQTKVKNSADMQDCITVPRTIFKGYLGIMIGTTLGSIATLLKPSKTKTAVAAAGIATAMYGTWAFVRPYILKGSVPTVDLSKQNNDGTK
ncbi:MAG: hypothetical protein NC200_03360 [Candidatus Gastranaerophilales bacterium]|nr:hypothetical protein [Candidatus Gastranaerophilales bacterium]